MRVTRFDERTLDGERDAEFVVFIYEGGDPGYSWSVDSYLLADTDLSGVLVWLRQNLPAGCCWSLGVVQRPEPVGADLGDDWPYRLDVQRIPTCKVAWIVGGDVLNFDPSSRSVEDERVAQAMLARRDSVQL